MKQIISVFVCFSSFVAFAQGQLLCTADAAPVLDTSVVRVLERLPEVPVHYGNNINYVHTLWLVRVLDSNRFAKDQTFLIYIRRVVGSLQPQKGRNYLLSSHGTPARSLSALRDSDSMKGISYVKGDAISFETEDAVWANFMLPTDQDRLAGRQRILPDLVSNMLRSIESMTFNEAAKYSQSDLGVVSYSLSRVQKDGKENSFTRGLKQIAERSSPEKAAALYGLRVNREIMGADRDYAQALLRVNCLPERTWQLEDFDYNIDPYSLTHYVGPPSSRPLPPITNVEAVNALEVTQYPEFVRLIARWIYKPTPVQIARLNRAIATKSPEVVAAIKKEMTPMTRSLFSSLKD